MSRRPIQLLGLLVALGGVLAWGWWVRRGEIESSSAVEIENSRTVAGPRPEAYGESESRPIEVPLVIDDRESATTRALAGSVLDANGAPVAESEITWIGVHPDWIPGDRGWDRIDWAALESAAKRTRSDARGAFAFTEAPQGPTSVLWVSHPGFEIASEVIAPSSSVHVVEVRLKERAPLVVRVVGSAGEPVTGAEVLEYGTGAPGAMAADANWKRAFRSHRARSITDEHGESRLAPFPGRHVVMARSGGAVAVPWFGEGAPAEGIRLVLSPTFEVSGLVRSGGAVRDAESNWVEASRLLNPGELYLLQQIDVKDDASFGPVRLPLSGGDVYQFSLHGTERIADTIRLDDLHPGDARFLEFRAQESTGVGVHVLTAEGDPIAGAKVRVAWWIDASRGESAFATSGADGRADVAGVRPGTCWVIAKADGFIQGQLGPLELPSADGGPLVFELERGGKLQGRVSRESKPLSRFDIISWTAEPGASRQDPFSDRADGTFELQDVSTVGMRLFAVAEDGCQSPIVSVVRTPEGPALVELEIGASTTISGQVVDALTSEPVPTAFVQRELDVDGLSLRAFGRRTPVEDDGRFAISGVGVGIVHLDVIAEGFGLRRVSRYVRSAEPLELGAVALSRGQDLSIRLRSPERTDFTAYLLEMAAPVAVPLGRFDSEGRFVLAPAMAGSWRILLRHPDGSALEVRPVLRPGRDWDFELPVGGPHPLSIEAQASSDFSLPLEDLTVTARFSLPDGLTATRSLPLDVQGKARIDEIPSSGARIEIHDSVSRVFAIAQVGNPRDEPVLRISLAERSQVFRVVDDHGAAVSNVEVAVAPRRSPELRYGATTDADGRCALSLPDVTDCIVDLTHPTLGTTVPVEVAACRRVGGEIEVVLGERASLHLRVRDHGVAQVGVEITLNSELGNIGVDFDVADSSGMVDFDGLGMGDYVVVIDSTGLWRDSVRVRLDQTSVTRDLPVFRLASVEIAVCTAAGLRVRDVQLSMRHTELDADVGAWMQSGQVPESPLRSDSHGVVRIDGLPTGEYRWTAGDASGVVHLAPSVLNRVQLTVP